MAKKINLLSLVLCLLFILVSCKDYRRQNELDEIAYRTADISQFFDKRENLHLTIKENYKMKYRDEDDTIYNLLVNIEYHEEDVSNLENKSSIVLTYDISDNCMFFYPKQHMVSMYCLLNAKFSSAEAERYYKVDETDFNTLYEKLVYCVANPNVEEKE